MFTLTICLFIACLFPYLSKIPVVMAMKDQPGGYNNNEPRAQERVLTGLGARAVAAHQNSFESLIIFAAACLTALATQHTTNSIQALAVVYLISRCFYHAFYLLNWATLRSSIWAIGLIASLSMIWDCIP
ncbi:MAG: MAPEG family protein [Legionellales bacterium]